MHQARRTWAARALVTGIVAAAALGTAGVGPASADTTKPAGGTGRNSAAAADAHALTKSHKYRHGVVPTRKQGTKHASGKAVNAQAQLTFQALEYFGGTDGVGVQTGTPKVYVVYAGNWGTASTNAKGDTVFSGDYAGVAPVQQEFFKGVGTKGETWSKAQAEYCQGVARGARSCPADAAHVGVANGGALAGVWYDTTPLAGNPDGNAIAQAAIRAAGHFGNTTAASNEGAQYVISYPPGVRPDGWDPTGNDPNGSFCAWHDYNGDPILSGGPAASPYGNVAFTNMPYLPEAGPGCGANFISGPLDGVTLVGGHEYVETLTDPFPRTSSIFQPLPDSGGWLAPITDQSTGQVVGALENADLCSWILPKTPGGAINLRLSTGDFPVQGTWSNAKDSCVNPPNALTSSPVVVGQPNGQVNIVANAGGAIVERHWSPSGGWSNWTNLGGDITGTPAVLYNPHNGNLEVYANQGGHLVEKYGNGGNWSGWQDFGGSITGGVSAFYNPNNTNIEVYTNQSGHLVEKYWDAGTRGWSGWADLGGNFTGTPSVFYNPNNNNIELYVNANGHLDEKYWRASDGAWIGFFSLGGTLSTDATPTVFYNPNNRNIELYVNANGHLEEKYWRASDGAWIGFFSLGGTLNSDPSVFYNPNNKNVELYVNANSHLDEKYWRASDGAWIDWQSLGGSFTGKPSVNFNGVYRNVEIYVNSGGSLAEKYWRASDGAWIGWVDLSY